VKLKIAWIGKTKEASIRALTEEYLTRIALLRMREKAGSRPAHTLVLIDSRGRALTSEEFAEFLANHQDRNPQPLTLAIGPANGFHAETRNAASAMISLGQMTLAHELARVVLLEQVYRAYTILKGHPYHTGH
jgi:23S rRNA (pseudouridine1915-N3)-methyltransferase